METVPAKTLLIRNKSRAWFGAEFNMNIYRGCCHGCLYCDSRSDCYRVERFDTVRAKENALPLLRNELAAKVKQGVVATGAMSDPYNPFEKKEELTRRALELLSAYGFGVAIATKSDLITRDIDLLREVAGHSPVICKITVTTHSDELAARVEPHAPPPSRRFEAIRTLAGAGLFTGVLLMPVLPWLEDDDENILTIVQKAAECGARFIYPGFGVTQRAGQREYFHAGLDAAFPGEGLAQRYRSRFGDNYYCGSPRSKHLWALFCEACQKYGLLYDMREIIRAYRTGHESPQLSFFDTDSQ